MDPIHQFQINNLFPIARIGGAEIAFTNSTVFMLLSLAIILLFMKIFFKRGSKIAIRHQSEFHYFYFSTYAFPRTTNEELSTKPFQ